LPSGPFVGVAVGGIILLLRAAARKPRRDGVVNREKILERAQELFATEGLKVSLHGIADDLGIGIDTVYRHFAAHADAAATTTTTRRPKPAARARARRGQLQRHQFPLLRQLRHRQWTDLSRCSLN